jgi:hypothetical protein
MRLSRALLAVAVGSGLASGFRPLAPPLLGKGAPLAVLAGSRGAGTVPLGGRLGQSHWRVASSVCLACDLTVRASVFLSV